MAAKKENGIVYIDKVPYEVNQKAPTSEMLFELTYFIDQHKIFDTFNKEYLVLKEELDEKLSDLEKIYKDKKGYNALLENIEFNKQQIKQSSSMLEDTTNKLFEFLFNSVDIDLDFIQKLAVVMEARDHNRHFVRYAKEAEKKVEK